MTPREEAISNAVQDAIKIWRNKYDKAMARAMEAEMEMTKMEEIQEDNINYESQLRDQFAVAAMNGIIVGGYNDTLTLEGHLDLKEIARLSYRQADQAMEERRKEINSGQN